jgi:hypothetical protein
MSCITTHDEIDDVDEEVDDVVVYTHIYTFPLSNQKTAHVIFI